MKKYTEHISVITVRATFLVHKEIMSEALGPNFPSYGAYENIWKHRWKNLILVMTACRNLSFNWVLTVKTFTFVFTHSVN